MIDAQLPARWRWQRLADVCDPTAPIMYGILQPGPEIDGGIPYVRPTEIDDDCIRLSEIKRTTHEIAGRYRRSVLKPGDLLITIVGTLGKIAVVPPELDGANITQSSARIRIAETTAHSRYIRQLLKSDIATRQYDYHKLGTGVPRLNIHHVRDLRIPVPPLNEQRRIAEVLDRAEALRAKRRAALTQLDILTQSIFLDLFGDPVSNSKGWPNTLMLGDAADIASGVTKGRKLKSQSTRTVPYLAVANVQDRSLNLGGVKYIEATDEEIDRFRLLENDLLLTEGGDPDKLGRGTLWRGELPECIHQNHIFRVRLTTDALEPLYLNWLVGSQRGKRYFLRSAKQTTGIASINMSQLRAFPLLVPPRKLQQDFAHRIAAVEKLKSAQRRSLAELDALFASLQHRAFRGEL